MHMRENKTNKNKINKNEINRQATEQHMEKLYQQHGLIS